MGALGTSTKHCVFSEITKNSTISKHRMFIFALCTCLVPVEITYCQYKRFPFLVESFPVFSGRTESRDLICIHHTYQNEKICKPIGLLKSYDIRTKALEYRPPPGFLGERTHALIYLRTFKVKRILDLDLFPWCKERKTCKVRKIFIFRRIFKERRILDIDKCP